MIDFQQKKQFKKIIYSKVFFVVFLILIIFLGRSTYDIYKRQNLSATNYSGVKKNYDGVKERKDMLEFEIERLKTDVGVEEEIRSKFNVAKPGETVVTIIAGKGTSTDASNEKSSFWSSFWGMFTRTPISKK